jgi:stearoyl-CoA desaturase (delta-9 desaturase)
VTTTASEPTQADLAASRAPSATRSAPTFSPPTQRTPDERINRLTSVPFIALHFVPLLAIFTGVTTKAVVLGVVLFYVRMFFITAGYHRYFSHRSYKLGRVSQFVMAFGAQTSAQKGALWWASHHRDHHKYSDTVLDIHSPQRGFWWSHVGWILCDKYSHTDEERIRDFAKYPELRWLNKYDFVAPWALAIATFVVAGWSGLLIGFFASTVFLWHATFTVNSLNHVWGRRRYATEDTSRNNAILALWTMGEGWHNNHHYYQSSARNGFYWWELDPTYYVLKALSWVGIVKDLKVPTREIRAANHIADGAFDQGMFRANVTKATAMVHAAEAPTVVASASSVTRSAGPSADLTSAAALDAAFADDKAVLLDALADTTERGEELARRTRRAQRSLRSAGTAAEPSVAPHHDDATPTDTECTDDTGRTKAGTAELHTVD